MAIGDIGGIGPGQVPADVRALVREIALTNAKLLTAALAPGEILTARVGALLGDGNVTLTLRGQTLIANSATALLPDSLVKLMVQSGGDQPVLRIMATGAPDQRVVTSSPASRAIALGLPSTALATVALQAFEQAGAPLDPVRLKEAVAQLQALPPSQVPQRAQALALLAQAGLPALPPFIALAERSATGALPNPAAALAALAEVAEVAEVQRVAQRTSAGVTAGGQQSVAGSQQPVVGQPPVSVSQLPVLGPQLPVVGVGSPIVGVPADTPTTAPPPPSSPPAPPAAGSPAPPSAPPSAQPSVPPSPSANVQVPRPLVVTPAPAAWSMQPPPLAPGSLVPASSAPAPMITVPLVPTATTLAGTLVPDLARGGATAVLQALALAGVRPRETGEVVPPKSEPTLLHRLDVPVQEIEPIRAGIDSATRQPPQPALDAAVAHVMREQAAETVVKPQALIDYDIVLGLPLQVMGQPLPARLAVAERQTSAGTATFLRVDAELTHLGPLSVRISGIENGPMAITVLATGPALGALAEALPDLNDSLRALGLAAGVRIADLIEDLSHG